MSNSEWKPNQQKFGEKYKLIGKDYPTADLYAKVTGKAKYAEDFRVDGMLFCKLLLSPVPHGRVKHLDVSKALAMPGVKAILTQDDLPAPADSVTDLGVVIKANKLGEKALTWEPLYHGEPVLAVAAVDEYTAAEAIEAIDIEFEHLPFAVDPLDTLRPGGPNPRIGGNVWVREQTPPPKPGEKPQSPPAPRIGELKWTAADFEEAKHGRLPMGKPEDEWSVGDLDAGFKNAALVLDETFVTPDTSHETLEPRTTLAYWQNGKVFVHMGTQSTVQTLASLARWLNMDPNQIVLISEYTGGGFGSKATGYIFAIIPALLSKKANAPVMMRVSREEERHPVIREKYGLLTQAAELVASPQIRNQGTLGGNVSQDTRCWYYRAGWPCYRAGGNICYADTPVGRNREHAILQAERCVAVNPSDTAPALIALDAKFVVATPKGERVVDAEDYFVGPDLDITRMNILHPGYLLTSIRIPATWASAQFYFEKVRDRNVWDFPLMNVASAAKLSGGTIQDIRIAVNAVAARPLRLKNVEDSVRGKARTAATGEAAGKLAVQGAVPLQFNAYKIPLMRNLVKRAVGGVEEASWAS